MHVDEVGEFGATIVAAIPFIVIDVMPVVALFWLEVIITIAISLAPVLKVTVEKVSGLAELLF